MTALRPWRSKKPITYPEKPVRKPISAALIGKMALTQLWEQSKFVSMVIKDHDHELIQEGGTLCVASIGIDVTLSEHAYCDFIVDESQLYMSIEGFAEHVLKSAMSPVVDQIDQSIASVRDRIGDQDGSDLDRIVLITRPLGVARLGAEVAHMSYRDVGLSAWIGDRPRVSMVPGSSRKAVAVDVLYSVLGARVEWVGVR